MRTSNICCARHRQVLQGKLLPGRRVLFRRQALSEYSLHSTNAALALALNHSLSEQTTSFCADSFNTMPNLCTLHELREILFVAVASAWPYIYSASIMFASALAESNATADSG